MATSKPTNSSSPGSKKTASYKVIIEKRVRKKDMPLIPGKDRLKIIDKIRKLGLDPKPAGSKKLANRPEYRVRQGKYRILYLINDQEVVVLVVKVAKRETVYR